MGWIKMGAGASPFFKNEEGPLFLLISMNLNMFIKNSLMITRLQKIRKSQMQIYFFILQPGLLHAQQGERGNGVAWCAVVEGHRPLQLYKHNLD